MNIEKIEALKVKAMNVIKKESENWNETENI